MNMSVKKPRMEIPFGAFFYVNTVRGTAFGANGENGKWRLHHFHEAKTLINEKKKTKWCIWCKC